MLEAAELGAKIDKEGYEAEVPQLRVDLINAQYDLRKASFPVLIVIAGDDRPACNEIIHVLHEWMDARYLPVFAFRPPTEEERERPRFWRYWREIPARGEARLFLSAWSTTAVGERMRGQVDDAGFERSLEHIERFEQTLVADGTLLLKFWMHLPRKQQEKRLKKAKKDPEKEWRLDDVDEEIVESWEEAVPFAERMLRRTSSVGAPWQVVESTDPRWRNLCVGRALLAALTARLERPGTDAAPATPAPAGIAPPAMLETVDLSPSLKKDEYHERLDAAQARLRGLQERARRKGVSSVLAFEGCDAAGKGGVIRRITYALDPRDYRLVPIAAPTPEEKAHHYLWRFWRVLPRAGTLLIFDRSWYGRVLVERVEGLAREDEWQRAYEEIVDFESQIVEHGIPLLKFWLQIDREEQERRFAKREETPYKKYKIGAEDYRNRSKWEEYTRAADEMIARTGTELAPWHLVASQDKRWARVQVLETLCETLEKAVGKEKR